MLFRSMLTNDLSDLAMDYRLRTGKTTSFMLKERMLKRLFASFYGHQEQRNVYGYLTEISAFRGIFSVMREISKMMRIFVNISRICSKISISHLSS